MASTSLTIPILHFNDVYNMTRSRGKPGGSRVLDPQGELHDSIDHVVQFTKKIQEIRDEWTRKNRRGLLLFSGDLFSASVESLLTRGRNMVHLMNELAPDACVPGNHEFDYQRPRFDQLIEFSTYPWVLSNAVEETKTGKSVLKGLDRYLVLEAGTDQNKLRIGIIGLMSKDTVSKIDGGAAETFDLLDMKDECMKLATELRGEPEKCDLVFALTHALYKEDTDLGKHVNCYTPAGFNKLEASNVLENTHGVDLILGGHDHEYYLGKGVDLEGVIGPEPNKKVKDPIPEDDGLLIIKSGTDFEDLSQVEITVEDRKDGAVRRKVITSVKVTRHNYPASADLAVQVQGSALRMSRILKRMLKKEVEPNMKTVIARLPDGTPLGALANSDEASRKGETALGNWIADSMIRWYAKHATRSMRPLNRPIFIMTGGSIRAGSEEVDPDSVTKGDIIRLLPFGSPLCTLRMSGKDLWDTFECALEESGRDPNDPTKINSAGRFPVVSGVWVEWKSTKPAGKRIVSMRLSKEKNNDNEVFRDENHFYDIITHTYLYYGGDHLSPFKRYSKSEDSEKHGYVTETPIYQALLQVIDDLLVDETKEIFNNPPTPDTRVSTVLPSGYPFSNMPQEILPILPLLFPFAPLLRIMADGLSEIAKDDRPNMVTQRLIDEAVTITKTHRLPVLDIPTGPDGRMEDTSMKDGSK